MPERSLTVAVMQPYFIPYAGYFRLFAAADLFIAYDCVQFPRRGWVHRNRVRGADGEERWLTLPLAKQPQDVLIKDLRFRDDADAALAEEAARFPAVSAVASAMPDLMNALLHPRAAPAAYLVDSLQRICAALDLEREIVPSSTLAIDPALRAEERILAICEAVGASAYVNASGGRELYDAGRFSARGITLKFFTPYAGPTASILQRLADDDRAALRQEILDNTVLD